MHLIVEGNRKVTIKRINQWKTYYGLIEGLTTKKRNDQKVIELKELTQNYCHLNEVYIIKPEQTPIEYDGKYPFGDPYSLTSITCVAELWYHQPVRNIDMHYSAIGIGWFQEEFTFPIEEKILKEISSF